MISRIPNDIVDAFDGGWLNDKELSTLCEDVIHELNARGQLVWPCIALNKEGEQIVIIDTEEQLWKEVHERAQREKEGE